MRDFILLAVSLTFATVALAGEPAGQPQPRRPFQQSQERIWAVALSPDGKMLASASDQDATVWDLATGKVKAKAAHYTRWSKFIAFSPDGRTVASSGKGESIELWDALTGKDRANSDRGS